MKTLFVKYAVPAVLFGALVVPAMAQPFSANGSINARLQHQQSRIQQGVRSGELTRHEDVSLERRETRLRRQEFRDRLANGGMLTPREHNRLERELNKTSTAIYRDKHNDRVQ